MEMGQVTECINCGWKASAGLSHGEHVRARAVMAGLCYRQGENVFDIAAILPPRPKNADPVTDDNGIVIGYTARP
jgi:hypothetical protein